VRYLSLAEALIVAEAVSGIAADVLSKSAGIGLLDSALHAPQASFGGEEFYPGFIEKAAVLAVRITGNHPLPDGNKRLAWACLRMFCVLNGYELESTDDDAVALMLTVAAGDTDEASVATWLSQRLRLA
jgi:death-on-curing protein